MLGIPIEIFPTKFPPFSIPPIPAVPFLLEEIPIDLLLPGRQRVGGKVFGPEKVAVFLLPRGGVFFVLRECLSPKNVSNGMSFKLKFAHRMNELTN